MLSIQVDEVLTRSLLDHFHQIPRCDMNRVIKLVAKFCARIVSPVEYEEQIKRLEPPTRVQARSWKRWALSSYYWAQLWRCIVSGESVEKWGVYYDDVNLVLSNLSRRDLKKLKKVKTRLCTSRFDEEVMEKLRDQLAAVCWDVYRRRLRFLTRCDPALSAQGFVSDLMEVGVRVLCRYEETASPEIALGYAKKAVRNHAVILIQHHMAERRRRIEKSDGNDRVYRMGTIVNDRVCSSAKSTSSDDLLFFSIRFWLGPAYERYARAMINLEPEFEAWVEKGRATYPTRLNTLSRLAGEWSGLSEDQLKKDLAPLLQDRIHLAFSGPM